MTKDIKLSICRGAAKTPSIKTELTKAGVKIVIVDADGVKEQVIPNTTVDQVFDAESTNAQSGAAIAGAMCVRRIAATQQEPTVIYSLPNGAYLLDGYFKNYPDDAVTLRSNQMLWIAAAETNGEVRKNVITLDYENGIFKSGTILQNSASFGRDMRIGQVESRLNRVNEITENSTHQQYPTAQAVYNLLKSWSYKSITYNAQTDLFYLRTDTVEWISNMNAAKMLPDNARIVDVTFTLTGTHAGVYHGSEIAAVLATDTENKQSAVITFPRPINNEGLQKICGIVTDDGLTATLDSAIVQNGTVTIYYEEVTR